MSLVSLALCNGDDRYAFEKDGHCPHFRSLHNGNGVSDCNSLPEDAVRIGVLLYMYDYEKCKTTKARMCVEEVQ
jgi:hypothetical protein